MRGRVQRVQLVQLWVKCSYKQRNQLSLLTINSSTSAGQLGTSKGPLLFSFLIPTFFTIPWHFDLLIAEISTRDREHHHTYIWLGTNLPPTLNQPTPLPFSCYKSHDWLIQTKPEANTLWLHERLIFSTDRLLRTSLRCVNQTSAVSLLWNTLTSWKQIYSPSLIHNSANSAVQLHKVNVQTTPNIDISFNASLSPKWVAINFLSTGISSLKKWYHQQFTCIHACLMSANPGSQGNQPFL